MVTLGSADTDPELAARDARQHRVGAPPGHGARMDPMTTDAVTDPEADELDDIDRELLNALQWDFPIVAQPYAAARRAARHLRGRGARPAPAG